MVSASADSIARETTLVNHEGPMEPKGPYRQPSRQRARQRQIGQKANAADKIIGKPVEHHRGYRADRGERGDNRGDDWPSTCRCPKDRPHGQLSRRNGFRRVWPPWMRSADTRSPSSPSRTASFSGSVALLRRRSDAPAVEMGRLAVGGKHPSPLASRGEGCSVASWGRWSGAQSEGRNTSRRVSGTKG